MPNLKLLKVEKYTLKNGDTLDSIAKSKTIPVAQLKLFNFDTEDEDEIKKYYWGRLGCGVLNDNGSFKYGSGDTPGTLFIPKISEAPLQFASNAAHDLKVEAPKLAIKKTSKCVAKFRPPDGWDGQFGFDWIREHDTGMKGDLKYKDNLDPATQYAALCTEYQGFKVTKAMANDADADNTAAWLSLFPEDECADLPHKATIKMVLDQRVEVPASIKVTCSNPDYKDHIEIKEFLPKTNGTHNIDIKCKTACDQDIVLEITSNTNDDKGKDLSVVIGKLVIPKNDKPNRPEAKVVFVRAWTNVNGPTKKIDTAYIQQMTDVLKKYCSQALITLTTEVQKFDMTVGAKFWLKKKVSATLTPVEQINKDWVVKLPGTKSRALMTDIHNRLAVGGGRQMLHDTLCTAFKAKYPQFNDYYPIFMFAELGYAVDRPTTVGGPDDYVGLDGCADRIPGSSVVVFGTDDDSTVSHELFHTWGLHHPFGSSSKYKFKNLGGGDTHCKTDNIMDYSHMAKPAIPMFQTWKWQWEIIQNSVKNKTWP